MIGQAASSAAGALLSGLGLRERSPTDGKMSTSVAAAAPGAVATAAEAAPKEKADLRVVTEEAFIQYLLGADNSLIDPVHLTVCQDMTMPITAYHINTSQKPRLHTVGPLFPPSARAIQRLHAPGVGLAQLPCPTRAHVTRMGARTGPARLPPP